MSKVLMVADVEMVVSWPVLVEEGATNDEIYDLVEKQIMYDYCLSVPESGNHPIKAMTICGTDMPVDPELRAGILWSIKELEKTDAQREAGIKYVKNHRTELDASYDAEISKFMDHSVISLKRPNRLKRILNKT